MRLSRTLLVILMTLCLVGVHTHGEPKTPALVSAISPDALVDGILDADDVAISSSRWVFRRGVLFNILCNGKPVGSLRLGVFADPELADKAFKEALAYTSGGLSLAPTGKIGNGKAAGHGDRLVWTRDNVLADLSWDAAEILAKAQAIDEALANGTMGVQRSDKVAVPTITKVEFSEPLKVDTEVMMTIHVSLPADLDTNQLCFTDDAGVVSGDFGLGLPPDGPRGNVELVYSVPCKLNPKQTERAKRGFGVSYATAGCVMTSKQVIPELPED